MKLLLAGGGTGGHLYPAVAIAEELLMRGGGHRVHFAGTARGLEARVLPALGFPLATVRARGIVGAGPWGTVRSLAVQAAGLADALRILRSFRPQACIGVGGYASFPIVAAARLLGVPSAIQEQNARPGLSNRVLGRFVQRIYLGDEAAAPCFSAKKVCLTGNPLRRALNAVAPYEVPEAGRAARVLVLGGSQGARALNELLPQALELADRDIEVLHQAGRGKAGPVEERYRGRSGVRVVEFIEDMAPAYAWANLVVARSGALTLAELASSGRPALLVPFPHSAGGHQEANARAAEARGAAVAVLEQGLTALRIWEVIRGLLDAPERLKDMAAAAGRSARRDAAERIVDDLLGMAGPPEA